LLFIDLLAVLNLAVIKFKESHQNPTPTLTPRQFYTVLTCDEILYCTVMICNI